MPLWTFPHLFALAAAELLVIGATHAWPPVNQTMAICGVFLLFVVTHFEEED